MRALVLAFAVLSAGCASSWESADGRLPVAQHADLGLFDRDDVIPVAIDADAPIVEGRWRALPPPEPVERDDAPTLVVERVAPPPRPVVVERPPPERARPTLPIPERRTPEPKPDDGPRDLEVLAREHFLRNPTHVRAERITLLCPPAYRGEVRLFGRLVETTGEGVRESTGDARLLLRELKLEADHLILRPGKDDTVQVLARGGVAFVSRVGERIMREEGLKSLVLTNDRSLPLR